MVWRVQTNPARYRALLAWSHRIGPIENATKAAEVMLPITEREDQENGWMMLLDTHGYLRGINPFARGARDSVTIPIQDALRGANISGTRYVVLVHNHPSGNPLPSDADVELTQTMARAAYWTGCALTDHVIMGMDTFYSFREGTRWKRKLLPF